MNGVKTMTLGLLILFSFAPKDWWTVESEVFTLIGRQYICMGPDTSFYVVDSRESELYHFDRSGNRVKVLARKGQGPEDIMSPLALLQWEDKIYVMSLPHLKIFEPGGFIKAGLLPNKGRIMLYPVVNGWVYIEFGSAVLNAEQHLYWADRDFEKTKALATWTEKPPDPDELILNRQTKEVIWAGRPNDLSFLRASKNGQAIYFRQIYTTQVTVFDAKTGNVKKTVEMGKRISRMNVGPKGNLYVRLNTEGKKEIRAIDQDGNEVPAEFPFGILDNLLAIEAGWAYWQFFDFEKEDLILGGCRESDIPEFLKAHATRFKLELD